MVARDGTRAEVGQGKREPRVVSAGNDIVHLANGDLRASILQGAGGTVGSFTVRGKPVLFPVTEPVTAGAWPAGGMPLCFPFAGRVWHQGKPGSYLPTGSDPKAMALHGFTFGKAWRVESKSASGVILSLCDDDATRAVFPWRFTLKLEYELGANALTTTLNIRCDEILPAADGVSMPVAPGFHPYFAARHPVGKQDGYFSFAYDHLEIPALETIAVTPEGNAGPKKLAADTLDGNLQGSHVKVPVHDEATHNLIFSGLSGRVARIGGIEISWTKDSPWRNLVCWAKPAQHFFCLEPWYGLPDAPHRDQGTLRLKEGASCRFDVTITCRE